MADSPTMRNRRRSTLSTSAPAGIASRNIGSVFATCTRETDRAVGSRLSINQPDARLYIQVPTLETTVAVHIAAKGRLRNGAQPEFIVVPARRGGDPVTRRR